MPIMLASLDDLRETHPTLGFALYAMVPDEDVTLEVFTPDGGVFSFTGATAAAAIATAFPPATPQRPTLASPAMPDEANVFD